jgi:hypothetical protein
MKLNQAKCTVCGAALEFNITQDFAKCKYCNNQIIVERAIEFAKVQLDRTQDIKKYRENLDKFVKLNSIEEISRVSSLIKDIIPNDYSAAYYFAYAKQKLGNPKFMYDFYLEQLETTAADKQKVLTHLINNSDLRDYSLIKKFIGNQAQVLNDYENEFKKRTIIEDNYSNIPRDVFICFSSANQDIAAEVSNNIEADGHTTWISTKNLRPNNKENYWSDIEKAIINASILLVISSAEAMISKDVQNEIELAKKYNKKTLEYKIDTSAHTSFFKFAFDGTKWIEGFNQNKKTLATLKTRIFEELQEIKKKKPKVPALTNSKPIFNFRNIILALVLILVSSFTLYQTSNFGFKDLLIPNQQTNQSSNNNTSSYSSSNSSSFSSATNITISSVSSNYSTLSNILLTADLGLLSQNILNTKEVLIEAFLNNNVDPKTELQWYVNGRLQEDLKLLNFKFKPSQIGTFKIFAQYNNIQSNTINIEILPNKTYSHSFEIDSNYVKKISFDKLDVLSGDNLDLKVEVSDPNNEIKNIYIRLAEKEDINFQNIGTYRGLAGFYVYYTLNKENSFSSLMKIPEYSKSRELLLTQIDIETLNGETFSTLPENQIKINVLESSIVDRNPPTILKVDKISQPGRVLITATDDSSGVRNISVQYFRLDSDKESGSTGWPFKDKSTYVTATLDINQQTTFMKAWNDWTSGTYYVYAIELVDNVGNYSIYYDFKENWNINLIVN